MNIPKPNEFAASKGFRPFPPRWERWLSSVRNAILAGQPLAGRFTTVDVHPGKGTVVNASDRKPSIAPTPPDICTSPLVAAFTGITFGTCGCQLASDGNGYDETQLNDINQTITMTVEPHTCPCSWLWTTNDNPPNVSHEVIREVDCSGTIIFDGDTNTNYVVIIDSGNIYVLIYTGNTMAFYATAAFTSFPITLSNSFTGCDTIDFDSPIADTCFSFGTRHTITGYGGSVTITQ